MFRESQQIGIYTLIRKIGKGGFGEVWLAERRSGVLTKKVAVKLPHEESVNLEAIKQEAALWEQVSKHENVLTIFDADIYDGQVAIISEFAEDGSLEDKLKSDGKFPIEQSIEMTIGILKGLAHLHSKNIVHRDIKPQNILLQGNTPRLADFGISRAMNTANISSVIIGTDSYMAPEALDGVRNVQTDIWSVGVVFYQLLKGSLPFPQQHYSERMFAILSKEFAPLPEDIPQNLREIVKRALAKKPAERFATADEMYKALDRALIYLRSPTFAPTEMFSFSAKEAPPVENSPPIITEVLAPSPPRYETPPTQASPQINLTPQGGIIIERKAVENKTLVDKNAGLFDTDSLGLPSEKDNSSKSIFNLTNETYPQWISVLSWIFIGIVSAIASSISLSFGELSGRLVPGISFGTIIFLFGEFSISPSLRKIGRGYSLFLIIFTSVIGWNLAVVFRPSDSLFGFFISGILGSALIVLGELLSWRFHFQKWIYAISIIVFSGLAGLITYGVVKTNLTGIFIVWQTLVLLAHIIAFGFGKKTKWLISGTAVLGFVSLLIVATARTNIDLATNSNNSSNISNITSTNANRINTNMSASNKSNNLSASNMSNAATNKSAANSSNGMTSSDYFKRAHACGEKNDYDCAIDNYTKAIESTFAFENPGAYNNRGNAYKGKGNYDQAISDYNESIRIYEKSPKNYETLYRAHPYYNRGNVYYNKSNYDLAIADYKKALSIDPNYTDAKTMLERTTNLQKDNP